MAVITAAYTLGRTVASDPINLAHFLSTMAVDAFFVLLITACIVVKNQHTAELRR